MLELRGKDQGSGLARGGSFYNTPGYNPAVADFLAVAESSTRQRQQEGWAIAVLLGLSVVSTVGCVVGAARIPLNIRTGLMTFASGTAISAYVGKRMIEAKEKLYSANDKLQESAIGDLYQYSYAGPMKTIAEIQGAIKTHDYIKRTIPEQYQSFALKRAALQDVDLEPAIDMSFLNSAIDVPSVDPSKVAPISAPVAPTGLKMVPNLDELEDSINPRPPYRDLSIEIADYDGHIAYVSKTRSGKTSSMIRSIQRSLSTGKHVLVIDCKGDDRLRDLPNNMASVEYLHFNARGQFPGINAIIDKVLKELEDRQKGIKPSVPMDIYIDEYNIGMDSACDYGDVIDPETNNKIKANLKWCRSWKRILLQGAAANIRLRASGHTSRAEDWGWNTGVLDSVSFVALGRKGAYESIEDLIKFQISDKEKEEFRETLKRYKKMDFGDAPLVLTTLHPLSYCVLPTVEDSALSSTSQNHDSGLSFTAEPEDPPAIPGVKYSTIDDYFQMMIRWKQGLDHDPTREEVKAHWFEQTRRDISEKALDHLMQILMTGTTNSG